MTTEQTTQTEQTSQIAQEKEMTNVAATSDATAVSGMTEATATNTTEAGASDAMPEQAPEPSMPAMTKKAMRQQKQFETSLERYVKNLAKSNKRKRDRIKNEFYRLKRSLSKNDFNALKESNTIHIPEQKNEKGEVTQKASSRLNKESLIAQAKTLLALKREERIKAGKRKKTSGRSSRRKAHRGAVAHAKTVLSTAKAEESAST